MIHFLEGNGYDVSYVGDADVDRSGSLLLNHKMFMSSGHDEYWSAGQRASVQAARDAGVNLAFFSGNEMFWKTRWGEQLGRVQHPVSDADHLQGDALQRADRPAGSADLDRGRGAIPRFSPPADGGCPRTR